MLDWAELLCEERFGTGVKAHDVEAPKPQPDEKLEIPKDQFRLPHERDHDRVLFSTPFRRMGDKTQVFPLESIESIRTRLTHSYEVSNIARSIGREISLRLINENSIKIDNFERKIVAILSCVGLAHDIGNPPFGHQGENAIRAWFKRNEGKLFIPNELGSDELTKDNKEDFLQFEGNAQTIRVVTKLQVTNDDLGLNLTKGTLAALMKYICSSSETNKDVKSRKKVGFFSSEKMLIKDIRNSVGLWGDARHPLALIMEACDDIAYSVLDAEDAVKKGLASFSDLLMFLEDEKKDPAIEYLYNLSRWENDKIKKPKLHPSEFQDVAMQKFRVHAIHIMVSQVVSAFMKNYNNIMSGKFDNDLISISLANNLCRKLKEFDRDNAFSHKSVLEVELNGYNVINKLMDFLWIGITDREDYCKLEGNRKTPFSSYVYSRISKNYRRIFEGTVPTSSGAPKLPIRYKEMQLLTDMVSGMTDQFCIDLHDDFLKHYREMRPIDGTCS